METSKAEVIEYKGIKFRRYPESPNWADRMYYVPNGVHRGRGVGRLHQEIWRGANGPIPEGCVVHHKDGDSLNNVLDNLDCISGEEHRAHHAATMSDERREWLRANMDKIRPAASAWHRSEEGRA